MKKLLTMLAVTAVVAAASADIVGFKWAGGEKDSVAVGTYIHTILDTDATADIFNYVSANQINVTDLGMFTPFDSQVAGIATVGPPSIVGIWATGIIGGGLSEVGQYAYAVNAVSATWAGIAAGDTIKIFTAAGPLNDLQPGGTGGVALPQEFSPGTATSVQVVPEPATALLFGIGGLGAWIVRNNKRKVQEEETEA